MAESLRAEARRRGVTLYQVRNERERQRGFKSLRQRRTILESAPEGLATILVPQRLARLIAEGNRLACGPDQDPPKAPRRGSKMCKALNDMVNPPGGERVGDWRWRLWVAVETMRNEQRRAA